MPTIEVFMNRKSSWSINSFQSCKTLGRNSASSGDKLQEESFEPFIESAEDLPEPEDDVVVSGIALVEGVVSQVL